MRIHYFSREDWEESFVRNRLPHDDITFYDKPFADYPNLTNAEAEVLCIFMESNITDADLARFPALKLIATRSTGFDHIDLAAAKARGITVVNVPFYGENTVAEFAFALMLALSRRVIEADDSVRAGHFSTSKLRGFDLAGKTLGVVGCGHIGLKMIAMAHGFGMNVLGFDVHQDQKLAEDFHFTYTSFDELLASSDIISLHAPNNPSTYHIINQDTIQKIKRGAYLINTARGALIETDALVAALKDGIIAGAALDVLEEEGDLAHEELLLANLHPRQEEIRISLENHYLITHPRVIVTPHTAFNTQEAVERILTTTIENIAHFAAGTPVNIVESHS